MTTTELTGTSASEPTSSKWMALLAKPSAARVMVVGGVLFTLLSLTRMITDGDDLTSSGTMSTTLRVTTPILLAGLAGLWAERVGIVNIGIEGMMILGTWFGGWGAWKYGPWVGLLLAVLAGCVGGLIHAFAVVRFNVNHVISGVAINLFAFGAMRYLSELVYTPDTGGGISKSPQQKGAIPRINMPFLSGGQIGGWKSPDMLGWLEKKRFFLLPDIAGVLRGEILVHNHCYRADEMAIMLDLAKEFGFRIAAFHHGVEAYKIADRLAAEGVCGALWADWWGFKMESFDGIQENIALVDRAPGGCAIVHSDSAEGIQRLNQEAAKVIASAGRAGIAITPEHAIRWITQNPAKAMGILEQTGTLEAGKMADVVLWNGNPFSSYAQAEQVYVDGARMYDRRDPARQPKSDFLLGQDLLRGGVR